MPDTDPTVVSELLADVRERLLEMSKRPIPAKPGKKVLNSLDPPIREAVVTAADDLRAEHEIRKAVAQSLAKQARACEKTMTADLARLREVAERIGAK